MWCALIGWPRVGLPHVVRGAIVAGGSTALAVVLLLYPGLHTPRATGEVGREAIADDAASGAHGATGDV